MYFEDKVRVMFLSPFKVLLYIKTQGSGFPYSSSFYYESLWEYEQVCLTDDPTSVADLGVKLNYHFGIVLTKSILIGSGILINETETQVHLTMEKYVRNKLSQTLIAAMEQDISRINLKGLTGLTKDVWI